MGWITPVRWQAKLNHVQNWAGFGKYLLPKIPLHSRTFWHLMIIVGFFPVVKWWNLCQNIFRGDALEREHRKRDAVWVGVCYALFPVWNVREGVGGESFINRDERLKVWVYFQQLYCAEAQGKFMQILFHQKWIRIHGLLRLLGFYDHKIKILNYLNWP